MVCLRNRKDCSHFCLSTNRSARERASSSLTFLTVSTNHSVYSCQIVHTLKREHKEKCLLGARVLCAGRRRLHGISQKLLTMQKSQAVLHDTEMDREKRENSVMYLIARGFGLMLRSFILLLTISQIQPISEAELAPFWKKFSSLTY